MTKTFKDFNLTQADSEEYKQHAAFKHLERYISFYNSFSDSILTFSTMGTHSIINIDTYVYSSIQGTLESVKLILEQGRIGDAFALLRKYHDSTVLNIYTNLYLEENHDIQKSLVVQEIVDWLNSKKKLPHNTYGSMSEYIEKSAALEPLFTILNTNESYRDTRKRCNDHTHFNYFENVLINDNRVHFAKRISLLDTFGSDLENIFILHLSCIFHLKDHYMVSSDYSDFMNVGMAPEPDCQYWVAPFIQQIFSDIIKAKRPDIAEFILDRTSMHLS
jgi:hypothetical protein